MCKTHLRSLWIVPLTREDDVSLSMLLLSSLPVQPQCLIGHELPNRGIARGDEGSSQYNTKRHKLWWDLLERSQALGDCMC